MLVTVKTDLLGTVVSVMALCYIVVPLLFFLRQIAIINRTSYVAERFVLVIDCFDLQSAISKLMFINGKSLLTKKAHDKQSQMINKLKCDGDKRPQVLITQLYNQQLLLDF